MFASIFRKKKHNYILSACKSLLEPIPFGKKRLFFFFKILLLTLLEKKRKHFWQNLWGHERKFFSLACPFCLKKLEVQKIKFRSRLAKKFSKLTNLETKKGFVFNSDKKTNNSCFWFLSVFSFRARRFWR